MDVTDLYSQWRSEGGQGGGGAPKSCPKFKKNLCKVKFKKF